MAVAYRSCSRLCDGVRCLIVLICTQWPRLRLWRTYYKVARIHTSGQQTIFFFCNAVVCVLRDPAWRKRISSPPLLNHMNLIEFGMRNTWTCSLSDLDVKVHLEGIQVQITISDSNNNSTVICVLRALCVSKLVFLHSTVAVILIWCTAVRLIALRIPPPLKNHDGLGKP